MLAFAVLFFISFFSCREISPLLCVMADAGMMSDPWCVPIALQVLMCPVRISTGLLKCYSLLFYTFHHAAFQCKRVQLFLWNIA